MTGYGSHPQQLAKQLKVIHNLSRFPLPPAAVDQKGQSLQENPNAMRDDHKAVLEEDRAAQSTCNCQGGKQSNSAKEAGKEVL